MTANDPVGELVLLCRAAAEAGEDWRRRLREDWVPRVVADLPPAAVRAALYDWEGDEAVEDVADSLEAAVISALARDGFD